MTSSSTRAARRSGRLSRTLEFVWLTASTGAFQATRLGTGLIAAAFIAPEQYAQWGLVLAVLGYSVYMNGGIASGLNRELPRFLGEGDDERATRFEAAGSAGSMVAAGVAVIPVGAIGFAVGFEGPVVILTALAAGAQQIYLLVQAVLRSRLRFNMASTQQAVLAVVFPVVGLPLAAVSGVAGLVLAQFVAFGVGALFGGRLVLQIPRLMMPELRHLAAIGIPIMVGGLIFAILTTMDRWAVLVLLGEAATGLYTLAALLSSSALLVSLVLAQQTYPRMAHALGAGEEPREIFSVAFRQSATVVALVAPISAALIVLAPALIQTLLPEYTESIPALQVLALGILPLVGASGFTNYLVVMNRTSLYLRLLIACLIIECVLAILLAPMGLTGIAAAASAAYAAVCGGAAVVARAVSRAQ